MRVAFWLLQDSILQWRRWVAGLYYVRHCLQALASLPGEEVPEIVAFVPESLEQGLLEPEHRSHSPWLKIVRIPDALLADRRARSNLRRLIDDECCDLLFPALTPPLVPVASRLMGWITDYQHKRYPEFFPEEEIRYRDCLFQFLIGTCHRIVCSSQSVCNDLHSYYDVRERQAEILRFTTDVPRAVLSLDPTPTLARWKISRPYLYLPYQFWVHKNHWLVFEAWRILNSRGKDYLLVCTGATEDSRAPNHGAELCEFLKVHGLEDSVRVLGLVDRDEQWQLYRAAKGVLQPSRFEGWSTSVEEARSLGKPILLSSIDTHREQMGEAGRYFSIDHPEELANLIERCWDEMPHGYHLEREAAAREDTRIRVRAFGRAIVELFESAHRDDRATNAGHVLPLLLHMQDAAQERLEIIERMNSTTGHAKPRSHFVRRTTQRSATYLRRLLHAASRWRSRVLEPRP